jgi:peptide/nickel transport system permease protein
VKAYILRRLLHLIPVLFLTSVIVFLMVYLIPGDPAQTILGPDARPEQIKAVRQEMGLDKPLPVQYVIWLGRALRGNLGKSFINDYPTLQLILMKLPVTLDLTVASFLVALTISLPLGVLSAIRPRGWINWFSYYYNALAMAVPTFWLGILLVLVFGLQFKLLPTSGYVPFLSDPLKALRFLVLPAITLGAYVSAVLARFLKAALLETLHQDYVRTARSKGLREQSVIMGHALKNALIPVVTVLGLQFGAFMGGAVITEAIFDYPGMGRMLLYAILTRDYSVVQGTILFVVTAFVLINLVTDVVYAFLDPRIRYQ